MGNQNEIWKDIEGYEGAYQVSNRGRVKSLNYNRSGKEGILKLGKDKDGYLQVVLCKNSKLKTVKIHRLVAQTFINNPNNLPEVNHKDENKENNCADNLEWCDRKYNMNYRTVKQKIGAANQKNIRCIETGEIFSSMVEAERKTGINQTHIGKCANNIKHYVTARRLHWQFV